MAPSSKLQSLRVFYYVPFHQLVVARKVPGMKNNAPARPGFDIAFNELLANDRADILLHRPGRYSHVTEECR